jgi:adenosylcobinamide-phosphate synthase
MSLLLALILDAILGEPKALWDRAPHPAILMGRAVAFLERHLNRAPTQRAAGVLTLALLVGGAGTLGLIIAALPFGDLWEVLGAAILLAHKSLLQHVRAVASGLRMSVAQGRAAVAMIVGRDVAEMDPPAVARSAIESAAENFSDGVVAPALWFLVGGLPGILIYKVVNTADSMIGYRTPQLEAFGWAAARFDDVLNWVPARVTAALILAVHGRAFDGVLWRQIRTEAARHRSPNAGWPEAALAPVLDVALSGPRSYHGRIEDFPFVHPKGRRDIGAAQIDAACGALWRSWAGLLALVALVTIVL